MTTTLSTHGWEAPVCPPQTPAPVPGAIIPGKISSIAEDANLSFRVLYPLVSSVAGNSTTFDVFNTTENAATRLNTGLSISATSLATSKFGTPFRSVSQGSFTESGMFTNSNLSISTWASIALYTDGATSHIFSRHNANSSADGTEIVLERVSAGNCRIRLTRFPTIPIALSNAFALPTDGTAVFLNLVLQHTTQNLLLYVDGVLVCTMNGVLKLNGHSANYLWFSCSPTCGWLGYSIYKSDSTNPDANIYQLPTYMDISLNGIYAYYKKIRFNYA